MESKAVKKGKMSHITLHQLTVAGMLSSISIVLSTTFLGYIPLGIANATTMHIPVIIGAILEGPVVGVFIGLIFGLTSFLRANTPLFADPLVAILPRLLIGIVAYYTYKFTKSTALAAITGTLTNTVGVLSLAVILKYLPSKVALLIALKNGILEVIVAVILTSLIVKALKRTYRFYK